MRDRNRQILEKCVEIALSSPTFCTTLSFLATAPVDSARHIVLETSAYKPSKDA